MADKVTLTMMRALLLVAAVAAGMPAGGELVLETPEPVLIEHAEITGCAFAPDGLSLWFSVKEGSRSRIFRLPLADGPLARPTGEPVEVTEGLSPVPFLGKLLFVRRGPGKGGLWVRDLVTGEETQVRKDPFVALPVTVSADGSVVLIGRRAGRFHQVGRVDLETGKYVPLPGKDMSQPAVDAAGERVLFVRAGQLWVEKLGTWEEQQLTSGTMECSWPVWDRSGELVAFCARLSEGTYRVGVLDLAPEEPVWVSADVREPSHPVFTPEGDGLAFASRTPDGMGGMVWRLGVQRLAERGR